MPWPLSECSSIPARAGTESHRDHAVFGRCNWSAAGVAVEKTAWLSSRASAVSARDYLTLACSFQRDCMVSRLQVCARCWVGRRHLVGEGGASQVGNAMCYEALATIWSTVPPPQRLQGATACGSPVDAGGDVAADGHGEDRAQHPVGLLGPVQPFVLEQAVVSADISHPPLSA